MKQKQELNPKLFERGVSAHHFGKSQRKSDTNECADGSKTVWLFALILAASTGFLVLRLISSHYSEVEPSVYDEPSCRALPTTPEYRLPPTTYGARTALLNLENRLSTPVVAVLKKSKSSEAYAIGGALPLHSFQVEMPPGDFSIRLYLGGDKWCGTLAGFRGGSSAGLDKSIPVLHGYMTTIFLSPAAEGAAFSAKYRTELIED